MPATHARWRDLPVTSIDAARPPQLHPRRRRPERLRGRRRWCRISPGANAPDGRPLDPFWRRASGAGRRARRRGRTAPRPAASARRGRGHDVHRRQNLRAPRSPSPAPTTVAAALLLARPPSQEEPPAEHPAMRPARPGRRPRSPRPAAEDGGVLANNCHRQHARPARRGGQRARRAGRATEREQIAALGGVRQQPQRGGGNRASLLPPRLEGRRRRRRRSRTAPAARCAPPQAPKPAKRQAVTAPMSRLRRQIPRRGDPAEEPARSAPAPGGAAGAVVVGERGAGLSSADVERAAGAGCREQRREDSVTASVTAVTQRHARTSRGDGDLTTPHRYPLRAPPGMPPQPRGNAAAPIAPQGSRTGLAVREPRRSSRRPRRRGR